MNQIAQMSFLILAGGTGGHVIPALAVAEELRLRGVRIIWIGTAAGIESRLVPAAGFELKLVEVKGLRGKSVLRKLSTPWVLTLAAWQSLHIIRASNASGMLGMGGFVSGPGAMVGRLLAKPLVVHEQNAIVGATNRILARFAQRVLSGFPQVAGLKSHEWVGNPVKPEIVAVEAPVTRLSGRQGALRLLIIGGSQGALSFNQKLPELLAQLPDEVTLDIRHQCGRDRYEDTVECYEQAGVEAKISEFIDDMAAAYAWSDVVLCRSGAMTVAEVAAAGVAAIFVPYPYAVSDHQTANAQSLATKSAALCISQTEFEDGKWLARLQDFSLDREQLVKMASKARQLAKPESANVVADICMEVINA